MHCVTDNSNNSDKITYSDDKSLEVHCLNYSRYFTYVITFVYILNIYPFVMWVLTSTVLETTVVSAEFLYPCCSTSLSLSSLLSLLVPSTEREM